MKEAGGYAKAILFLPGVLLYPISYHLMLVASSKKLFTLNDKDVNDI